MSNEKLKLCPFCNNPAAIWRHPSGGYVVHCTNGECHAAIGPDVNALMLWNTRQADTPKTEN